MASSSLALVGNGQRRLDGGTDMMAGATVTTSYLHAVAPRITSVVGKASCPLARIHRTVREPLRLEFCQGGSGEQLATCQCWHVRGSGTNR